MLFHTPMQKVDEEKACMYYYLRCGLHGKIIIDNIICPKWCNRSKYINNN